jgi:hypothetical protein
MEKPMTKTVQFLLVASLLFWSPVLAAAQETDTSGSFEASAEVDVDADAEMNDTGASAGTSSSSGGTLDPGPDRTTGDHEGAPDAGTLGIGADGLLSGLAGIQGRYQITDGVGLQLATRFNVSAFAESTVGFGIGLSGIFTVFEFVGGHLALVASVDFELRDEPGPMGGSNTTWDMGIGGGIFAEIFPADFFSIHAQAGLRVGFGEDQVSFQIGGDVLAGFGFTFWFI